MEKHSYKAKQTNSTNVNQQLFHFLREKNHHHKLIRLRILGSWDKRQKSTQSYWYRNTRFHSCPHHFTSKELSRKPAILWSTLLTQILRKVGFVLFWGTFLYLKRKAWQEYSKILLLKNRCQHAKLCERNSYVLL